MKLSNAILGNAGLPDGTYTGVIKKAGVTSGTNGERVWVSIQVSSGDSHVGAFQMESWPTDKAQQASAGLAALVEVALGKGQTLEDTDQLLEKQVGFAMRSGRLFARRLVADAEPASSDDTPTE